MTHTMRMETQAKTALIVGASSGIGKETARLLLENGWTVYNASRTKCSISGVKNLTMDAADGAAVDRAMKAALKAADGRLDAFVYSAGFSMAAPLERAAEADYRYLFEVNFFGFIRALQTLLPAMRAAGGGRVVVVSSMGGVLPIAFDAFYSASKAAVNLLVKALAMELAPYNIHVSSFLPGGTATGFTAKRKVYEPAEAFPYEADLAKAAANLAATEQSGMTGTAVAESLYALLNAENPPLTTAAGTVNKVYKLAEKLLPEAVSAILTKNKYLN